MAIGGLEFGSSSFRYGPQWLQWALIGVDQEKVTRIEAPQLLSILNGTSGKSKTSGKPFIMRAEATEGFGIGVDKVVFH